MSDEPKDTREIMLRDDFALTFTDHMARQMSKRAFPNDGEGADVISEMFCDAMRRVLGRAESPIERLLFGWLVIEHAACGELLVVLDPAPRDDVFADAQWRRDCQRAVHTVAKQAKKDKRSLDEYVTWMQETGRMEAAEADHWRAQILGWELRAYDALHLVPNAALTGCKVNGRGVRVDAWFYVPARPSFSVVVECDGYEWHGDKSAFTDDRQRDRVLRTEGHTVLRYAGAEIHRDPMAAGRDLYEQLHALRKKARKQFPPFVEK